MAQDRLNQDDLTMRLNDTICRWKGHPYYVMTTDGQSRYPNISLYKLDSILRRSHLIVNHTEDFFDDSSPPLGYMNHNNMAFYLKRMPYRWNNQGIKQQSIESLPSLRSVPGHWFSSMSIESCILGRYPSLDQAMSTLQYASYPSSVAIHRDIAIGYLDSRRIGLHFKARLVAIKQDDGWNYLESPDRNLVRKIVDKTGVIK